MKKKYLALTFLFFIVFQLHEIFAQPVNEHGKLSVDGINLVDQQGEKTRLCGVSFSWHTWWPQFYNKQAVNWLYEDWGCNIVRAAMGVHPEKGYMDDPDYSKGKVEAVVEGAIETGIYVIIDWHSHKIELEAAKGFFAEMAEKYGKYPNVLYEIFNEPVDDPWEKVKEYSIEIIKTIRKYDPDNIIIVGSPTWSQDVHIAADNPVSGFDNLMYSIHFYAGTHGQYLRDRAEYAMNRNLPIFISESAGMEASGDGDINYDEWNKWITWMERYNLSWITWSISDKNETCSMLKEGANPFGNWKGPDLKESGIKTREMIRKLSGKY